MRGTLLVAITSLSVAAGGCGARSELRVPVLLVPRQIAPLSTARVTSTRPTLRWERLARTTAVHVELCRDPECTRVDVAFDAAGDRARPTRDLEAGVWFWRLTAVCDDGLGCTGRSPVWEFRVPARAASGDIDTSWGSTLDLNRDGLSEWAVQRVAHTPGSEYPVDRFVWHIYAGSAALTTAASPIRSIGLTLQPPGGVFLRRAGDLDGDGYPEFLLNVGDGEGDDAAHDRPPRIEIYAGGAAPAANGATAVLAPGEQAPGQRVVSWLGADAGDVDGDGYGDVVAGSDGAAYWYPGGPHGVGRRSRVVIVRHDPYGIAWPDGIGDLNADGFADIGVLVRDGGAPRNHLLVYGGTPAGPTAMPVLDLTPLALGLPPDTLITGVLGGGDFDGDGYADVIVAHYRSSTSSTYSILRGSADGLVLPTPPRIYAVPAGALTSAPGGIGDFDGDGYEDVVLHVLPYVPNPDPRLTFEYRGSASGLETAAGVGFAWVLAMGYGDINGDGRDDVVVQTAWAPETLAADVHFGSARGLSATPDVVVPLP